MFNPVTFLMLYFRLMRSTNAGLPITWSRSTRDDAFTYKMANGWDLRFSPGQTYICLINPYVSTMQYE